MLVTLATSLPAGSLPDSAWSIWGDPRIEWHRPVRATLASLVAAVRLLGVSGAIRRLDQLAQPAPSSSSYRNWVAAHTLDERDLARLSAESSRFAVQPLVTVIMPVFNTAPSWLSRAIESVRRQAYPNWQLSICDDGSLDEGTRSVLARYADDPRITLARLASNQGISAASNAALANARGEWIVLLDHDDELSPDALAELVRRINTRPDADVVYSDEDKLDLTGARCDPFFKPDWAPEHLLSCMYTCHMLAARRALVVEAGGFRHGYEGSQDYDLMLRLADRTSRIEHIAKVLYHWRKSPESAAGSGLAKPWAIDAGQRALEDYVRRNDIEAVVLPGPTPGRYRVRRSIGTRPSVSIIVGAFEGPTSRPSTTTLIEHLDRTGLTAHADVVACVAAGGGHSRLGSSAAVRVAVVPVGDGRIAAINALVRQTRSEHVLFLDSDLLPTTSGWLDALLELSLQQAVGAVGGKLLDDQGRLSHIGLVMGLAGIASSPFSGYPATAEGYISSAVGLRNYSAVSGACLMTRRSVFEKMDGFDERMGLAYAAVDYCLRAGRAGYRVVFTPYACLQYTSPPVAGAGADEPSARLMHERWGSVIADDPYYNPNLSREHLDCRPRSD